VLFLSSSDLPELFVRGRLTRFRPGDVVTVVIIVVIEQEALSEVAHLRLKARTSATFI